MMRTTTRHGFTLTEIMVAVVVFAMAAGGMYAFLQHGNRQSMKAYTRQALVTQANTVLKAMQDDFRMAASSSLKFDEQSGEVTLQQNHGDKVANITYKWEKPRLIRKVVFNGSTSLRTLSTVMNGFAIETKPRPSISEDDYDNTPEQVVIKLNLAATVPGEPEPLVHDQHAIATMREVSSFKYDPHWRDVGNLKGAFSTYGNLLNSIAQDAKLLVEDIGKTLEQTIKDAEKAAQDALNKPKANLEETKRQLRNALNDIKNADLDLAAAIKECEQSMKDLPEEIFEREFGRVGTWFADKGEARDRVAAEFQKMKTLEQMDYSKLERAAGSFRLKDTFKSIFDNKKESLQQQVNLASNKKKLEDLLSQVEAKGLESGGGG